MQTKSKFLFVGILVLLLAAMAPVGTGTASQVTNIQPTTIVMAADPATEDMVDILITFRDMPRENAIKSVKELKGRTRHQFATLPILSVSIPARNLDALAKMPNVANIELEQKWTISVVPNDPMFTDLWGMQKVQAPAAWDIETGSQEVVVAVIDQGMEITHPDLANNVWTNPGEIPDNGIDDDSNGFIDDVYGWDFYYDDNSVFDGTVDYHGTHVAGTIGAVGNNGIGVVGVNWNIKMMSVKFLGPGGGSTTDAIASIEYATMMGADIISASWGGGGYSEALRTAINNFPGPFVAAAGNSAVNTDVSPHYPSSYDCANIIAVASTTSTDELSSFSNYGPTSVDLAAPGSSILSTYPISTYDYLSGTSMATPHVSGACALLLANDPTLTPEQVKAKILTYVDPVAALEGQILTGGRLNVYNSLTGTTPPPDVTAPSVTINSPTGTVTGIVTVNVTATDDVGVVKAEYSIDGGVWRSLINTGGPFWTDSFDTSALPNGTHTIDARANDLAGNVGTDSGTFISENAGGGGTHVFNGVVSAGADSPRHQFLVPSDAYRVEVTLEMPTGTDFDLSLWDDLARRTGGYTSTEFFTSLEIPNSEYSGYSVSPEWINVAPIASFGTWEVGCYAYSGSGAYTITVAVFTGVDTEPPTIAITNPVDGATVSGTVIVEASASDNFGVTEVEFYIDGVLKGTDTSSPYTYSWDTTTESNGTHTIKAVAYDAAGYSSFDEVTVTVENAPPPTNYVTLDSHTEDVTQYVSSNGNMKLLSTIAGTVVGNPTNIRLSFEFPSSWTLKLNKGATLLINGVDEYSLDMTFTGNTAYVYITSYVTDGDSFSLTLSTQWTAISSGSHSITATISFYNGVETVIETDVKTIFLS